MEPPPNTPTKTAHYKYNILNQVIATTDGNGNETQYKYNTAGNITEVTNADYDKQTYEYDLTNKVTAITDFNGAVTKREYNAMGKPCKAIDPLGRETTLTYDQMQNITQVKDATGFNYDALNRFVHLFFLIK